MGAVLARAQSCLPASPSPFLQRYFSPIGVQPVQLHEVITSHVQNVTIQQMQFLLKQQRDWGTEITSKTCVVKSQKQITHNDHLKQIKPLHSEQVES